MELFIKLSSKSELQECLNRDLEKDSCACAVEEPRIESKPQETPELFPKPKKDSVFQVDLMRGWVQP